MKVRIQTTAELPKRAHALDVGYDLPIVSLKKKQGQVAFYGTGVSVQPTEPSIYLELVPRSSLSKTGYLLANSPGIIDPNYTGEILVALRKVDPDAPDLELPVTLVQLVPRRRLELEWVIEPFEQTARGAGSFGSTN